MTGRRKLTPRKAPVQDRARQSVEAILQAAAQLLTRRGYAGTTTNHIAERAGLSVGSLYQYFPSKDAILVALLRRHITEGTELVGRLLGEALSAPPGPIPSLLGPDGSRGAPFRPIMRRFVDAMVTFHDHEPELHRVLFEEAPHPPAVRDELTRIEDAAAAAVAQLLRRHAEVRVADPAVAAWMVVQLVEAMTHRFVQHPPPGLGPEAFAEELTALLASYLTGASPPRSTPP